MGVVYRARQTSLNRLVAVKMFLARQLASDDDVQRFRAEAEASVNLDHPGIVPIFEVGEHRGLHYFSMGLVDRTSLSDRIRNRPLSQREAANVVRHVAKAFECAHQHDVIRRDLKSSNVLVDESDQPKVVDFGLARRVERDSELTGTGQTLGTPEYMPAEQAAGKIERVGPVADMYSLRVLFYCTLTGRPPFQSSSTIETLDIGVEPGAGFSVTAEQRHCA